MLAKLRLRTDPREEQQVRRLDRAPADDHLAASGGGLHAAVARVLDARAAVAVKEQTSCLRVRAEGEVRAAGGRVEVGLLRAETATVLDVDPVPAGALHVLAVEVVAPRVAELAARVDERLRGRVRPVLARVLERQRLLEALEVREALRVRPAVAPVRGPIVVVRGMAPDVHHDVEVARAARRLAARLVGLAAVQRLLWDAHVAPVDLRAEEREPERGNGDVLGQLVAAGLEREDGGTPVLAEAVREHSPGRPGADDDEVVLSHQVRGPRCPPASSPPCLRPRSGGLLRRGDGTDLLHEAQHVGAAPALEPLAPTNALDRDAVDLDALAGRRHPEKLGLVSPGRLPERRHALALGDLLLDLVVRVREGVPERVDRGSVPLGAVDVRSEYVVAVAGSQPLVQLRQVVLVEEVIDMLPHDPLAIFGVRLPRPAP